MSNLVNGTTRLQPVVCEIGQAAGTIAALAVKNGCAVRDVKVRDIQKALLDAGAYLQPYLDLSKDDPDFKMLQRIGCTGILHAIGKNVDWANQSWMRIGDTLIWDDLYLDEYYGVAHSDSKDAVKTSEFVNLLSALSRKMPEDVTAITGIEPSEEQTLSRLDAARAIDTLLHPFDRDVDFKGNLK